MDILIFILYQIPTILPICLPISTFVATIYVIGRSNQFQEIIALLTSGVTLSQIRKPFLYIAVFLSCLNFFFVSQLTPLSKTATKSLLTSIARGNPLLLLTKRYLLNIQDMYVDMQPLQVGKSAQNLYLGLFDHQTHRIRLVHAKKLMLDKKDFVADGLFICFYSPSGNPESFDHLFTDNIQHTRTDPSAFAFISTNSTKKTSLAEKSTASLIYDLAHKKTKKKSSYIGEIAKRLFFSYAVVSFFLLGFYSSISTARDSKKRRFLIVLSLFIFTFACFLIGRGLYKQVFLSLGAYILPHVLIYLYARKEHSRMIHGAL